jgi:peptidoglycan-binding domain 1 protein
MIKDFFNKRFFDRNKGIILISGSLLAIVIIGTSILLVKGHTGKKAKLATSSEPKLEAVVPISFDGAMFPAVDVDVPSKEPAPEYIRDGADHEIIMDLQERLMQLGFMEEDEPTSYYGPVTQAAVKVFQRQSGLPQDGIVGPQTLAAILDENAKPYSAKLNDSGDDISRIQQRLYDLGYLADSSQVNGTFGDKTDEAVRKFQQINSLPIDGTVGLQTLNKFYSDDVHANMSALGEKSDVVLASQNRLFQLGYMTSTPDGTYGSDTLEAIKRFQSKNNIVVDGYLGPDTRIALSSDSALPNSLDIGDSGSQVSTIQSLLVKWGYLSDSQADGYYGDSTKAAVSAFQERNSLDSDGKAGTVTIAKLTSDNALRPLPKPKPRPNTSSGGSGGRGRGSSGGGGNSGGGGGNTGGGGGSSPPPASNSSGVNTLLAVASSKLGTPYVWGAKGPNAFDCSGFVYWCLNNSGVSQSYMTSSGWRDAGRYTRISNFSDIQAGDIVVVSGHVGIATGGGGVIDASSSNGRVVSRSLSGWWERNFKVAWRIF